MKQIEIKLKGGDGQRIKSLPQVPTSVSELDDANEYAKVTDLNNYATNSALNSEQQARIDADNLLGQSIESLGISKQETLVSGVNIKTINNTPILGSGDIPIIIPETSIDDLTITKNLNNELQAVSLIHNTDEVVTGDTINTAITLTRYSD